MSKNIIDPQIIIPLSHYQDLKNIIDSRAENLWINTEIKPPPEGEDVLLYSKCEGPNEECYINHYVGKLVSVNGGKYFSSGYKLLLKPVQYWMHIPLLKELK